MTTAYLCSVFGIDWTKAGHLELREHSEFRATD